MMSDRMMMDMALGRQQSMMQNGLPALTEGINPGALQEFFGLPSSLQGGYDQYPQQGQVPNLTSWGQGGQQNSSNTPQMGSKGQMASQSPNWGGGQAQQNQAFNQSAMGPPPMMQGGAQGRAQQAMQQMGPSAGGSFGGVAPNGQTAPAAKGGSAQTMGQGMAGANSQLSGFGQAAAGAGPLAGGGDPSANQSRMAAMQGAMQGIGPFAYGQAGGAPMMQSGVMGGPSAGVGDIGGQQQGNPLFGGTVGGLIDPETFGQLGSLDQLQDFDMDRGRVEQSMFDRSSSLLNPQFDQAEQRMVSDLRARGIPRDSEAFEREMSNFRRDKGETMQRLADQSVLAGGGEQSRLFGISGSLGDRAMNAQTGMFNMADHLAQRDIQAQLQNANIASSNRATQFNELASLLGLQQVASPQLNNFFAPGNVDMMGAYGLNQQAQAANASNAAGQKGGVLGGLGQLGGAALGAGGWGGLFNMGG
jgi:hypothetical protein